jgi:FkbM family methyltransferase
VQFLCEQMLGATVKSYGRTGGCEGAPNEAIRSVRSPPALSSACFSHWVLNGGEHEKDEMRRLVNRLPVTRIKIFIARLLYRLVHLVFRRDQRIITRKGITYEIDLSEGIDLSVFLFGKFQKHVFGNKRLSLDEDAVIVDVGANFGMMTLQFAKMAPLGKIYAFEPTHYAFSKLRKNLRLNPDLAERIIAVQSFVSSTTSEHVDMKAHASWKVGGASGEIRHSVHGGTVKSAEGVGVVSLDDFCQTNDIRRVDLIKIDTDGYELEVLTGAKRIIAGFRPAVIFEIGLYILEEMNVSFSDYLEFFGPLNYSLVDSSSFARIEQSNYRKYIPSKATIDILALPTPTHEDN